MKFVLLLLIQLVDSFFVHRPISNRFHMHFNFELTRKSSVEDVKNLLENRTQGETWNENYRVYGIDGNMFPLLNEEILSGTLKLTKLNA